MSALVKGLAGHKKHQEEVKARQEARDRPKAEWLGSVFPKDLGDVIEIRFLQELDEGAANYDAARGIGFGMVEHEPPGREGFKRRALCTAGEGDDCYGCERKRADYKPGSAEGNWKTKTNFYINVAVKGRDGEVLGPFVLTRNQNSSFVQALYQEAIDEDTITDKNFRVTKTGDGTSTQWLLKPLVGKSAPKPLDVDGLEVFDLDETVKRNIPYEQQAEYYAAVYKSVPQQDENPDDSW